MPDHHMWSANMTEMEIGRKEIDCHKKKNPTDNLPILKRDKGTVTETERVRFSSE